MGLLSGLWNAATWVWNQLQNVAPGFTEAVTNTVTNIVDTVVNAVQNNGSQSNTPAQPATPTTPTGPTPEEIRQQRINQRADQFDRDISRLMRPELEEDARFYDEYPSDSILNSPASMADMILLAGQNPVVYGLMQMMRNERQTLNIVMQNAKSTVDGLRLLFADAIHYEDLAVEAAKVWDQCVGGSSTSWQPGMSSVGFDFVVSNSDWVSPSQDEDIIPDTARERSEEYSRWSANLKSLSSPVNDIKFYDAAAWVTNLLGFSEGGSTKALLELVTKGRSNIDDTNQLLDQVGERLYEVNSGIYPMLVSGQLLTEDGRLISPRNDDWMLERLRNGYTVNSDGFLVDPQGEVEHGFRAIVVDTAVDWDIHMAYTEQFNVQNVLFKAFEDNGDTFERNVKTINLLLNMGDPRFGAPDWFPVVGEGGTLPFAVEVYQEARGIDTRAVDWAEKARGIDHIDFSVTDDRMAIAMAIVMLEHGFTEDEYLTYLQAITNEDGSIGRSNPPSVFDVLSVSGDQ